MSTLETIREMALTLKPEDLSMLIDDLLVDLYQKQGTVIERAWAAEADSRFEAFERGEIEAISLDELKRQIAEG